MHLYDIVGVISNFPFQKLKCGGKSGKFGGKSEKILDPVDLWICLIYGNCVIIGMYLYFNRYIL